VDVVNDLIARLIDILWGVPTFVVLLGVGVLFSIWSKFIQFRSLTHGVQLIRGKYDDRRDPGAINHFQALSTALSGTVGLGNIGGVALAITIGGPGALFWMWVTGFFGMAIKTVEVTLAMLYRDTSDPDNPHGGAMWVIERGFGQRYGGIYRPIAWSIGALFCLTLLLATITSGNMFQAWNVANITHSYFGIPQLASGVVMATLTGLVILGGIKRIGDVTGLLVPLMCGLYLIAGGVVLVVEAANIPALLVGVVRDAFAPTTAQGAFLGATAWFGLTTGLRRALFSNEAAQGTSPIAHSAAKTDEPAREGIVAGLEPFVDTCLVCTLTALVILATGAWNRGPIGNVEAPVDLAGASASAQSVPSQLSVESLPKLKLPERWAEGYRFFLLAEVPHADSQTGSHRVKVSGTLVAADSRNPDKLTIQWSPVPPGAKLMGKEVYRDFTGAALTGHAFDRAIPGLGKWLVTVTCWLFAISTMISWSYYGEQAIVYLAGSWAVAPYKLLFCVLGVAATLPGFIRTDAQLSNLADIGSGCMLFANAPIIVLMAYQAIATLKDYLLRLDSGRMESPHQPPGWFDLAEGNDVED
jgi:AGCS family alanine or glycine:cation symporter